MINFLMGLGVSFSLLVVIGVQNLFLLKRALNQSHVLITATVCFLCDCLLISIGIFGVGNLLANHLWLQLMLALSGGIFLTAYGLNALKKAFTAQRMIAGKVNNISRTQAVLSTLAITLLNPQVYLDTVVIIGGVTVNLAFTDKIAFMVGALFASFLWFASIAWWGHRLAPFFAKPRTWKILDFTVAIVMFAIASSMYAFVWKHFPTV